MKSLITFCLMLCLAFSASAQSVWQRTNSRVSMESTEYSKSIMGVTSPNNAWLGSGVAYEFGDSDLDNILVSGTVLLELGIVGEWHIPIMSDVEITFDNPIKELNIGVYPWKMIGDNFITHGAAEFRTDGELVNKSLRLFVGGEYAFFNKSGLPLTISAAPVVLIGDNTEFGLEAVVVIPVANGLGLLGQVEYTFNGSSPIYSLGFVTNKIL